VSSDHQPDSIVFLV